MSVRDPKTYWEDRSAQTEEALERLMCVIATALPHTRSNIEQLRSEWNLVIHKVGLDYPEVPLDASEENLMVPKFCVKGTNAKINKTWIVSWQGEHEWTTRLEALRVLNKMIRHQSDPEVVYTILEET